MTWRDSLQKASFRGVPFHVQSRQKRAGRRVLSHKFPQRDGVVHEDLGQDSTKFTVEGIVIGQDYFAARDALEAALIKQGVGSYIDPFKGSLNVVCLSYTLEENFKQGGMATFSIEFEKAADAQAPVTSVDTKATVSKSSYGFLESLRGDFVSGYVVDKMPNYVKESAEESVKSFANLVSKVSNSADDKSKALLNLSTEQLKASASTLVEDPDALSGTMQAVMAEVQLAYDDPIIRQQVNKSLSSLELAETPAFKTAARIQQSKNAQAFSELVKRTSMAHEATALADQSFDSSKSAIAARNDLADRMDQEIIQAADAGQDQTYQTLTDLRVASVRDMTERSANLPQVIEVEQKQTEPALVIANRLYGDEPSKVEAMSEDIAKRNNATNPSFVIAGAKIEVLNNA